MIPSPEDFASPDDALRYPGDVVGQHASDSLLREIEAGLLRAEDSPFVGMPLDWPGRLRWFASRRRVTGSRSGMSKELYPWRYNEVVRAVIAGASSGDIARELNVAPNTARAIIAKAWAWARARNVEADPRDVYTELMETLRVMRQGSLIGLSRSRPSADPKAVDRSTEHSRYGRGLAISVLTQIRLMKEFGVLGALQGNRDRDREEMMDDILEGFGTAVLALSDRSDEDGPEDRAVRFVDHTGDRHGLLVATGVWERRRTPRNRQETWWLCRCECGSEVWLRAQQLAEGRHKGHCGCKRGRGYYTDPNRHRKPGARRRVPDDVVDSVVSWREQGEKLSVIAAAHKLKPATVATILSRRKVGPIIPPEHRMSPNARRAYVE